MNDMIRRPVAETVNRTANDAFWERKFAEARASGQRVIEVDVSDIPMVEGVAICLPSIKTSEPKWTMSMPARDRVRLTLTSEGLD